jgi:hypothetical protein
LLAANEPIRNILVPGAALLDDDVIDDGHEPGIANERQPERIASGFSVTRHDCYDAMRAKCVHNRSDSLDRDGRSWRTRLSNDWHDADGKH